MGVQHQVKKIIDSFKGLDKRTSDLIDNPEYASEMVNTDYRDNRTIVKRKGMHYLSQSVGGYGLFTYKEANIYDPVNNPTGDGSVSDQLLCADNNLHKMVKETVTINHANNPSNPQNIYVTLALDPSTNTFKFTTSDGGSVDIGTGIESSPVTLSSLATSIAALVDPDNNNLGLTLTFSSGLTGNETAAFLEPFESVKIADSSTLALDYHTWDTVPFADADYNSNAPFTQYFANKGNDSLENISHVVLNNNMYFANGYDELMKYDGAKVYRAGLPKPAAPTVTEITTPQNVNDTNNNHLGVTNGTGSYYYRYVLKYTDANGNTITSQPSDYVKLSHSGASRHVIKVDIPELAAGTGFDISSPNMKILLYRTKGSIDDSTVAGANFYLINTGDTNLTSTISASDAAALSTAAPNAINLTLDVPAPPGTGEGTLTMGDILNTDADAVTGTITFLDYLEDSDPNNPTPYQTTDTLFLEEYVEGRHDLPPKGRYLTVHQGCLVIAGRHDFGNEFNYSLPDLNLITGEIGTEYFPSDDRSLIVESPDGGKITAVASLKDSLYVFHENAITYLTGDISVTGAPLPRKDVLTKQGLIGSSSHQSIQEYESTLSFLSEDGIYNINASNGFPSQLSKNITPLFRNKELIKKRALSFYDKDSQLFLFYIPREGTYNNTLHATDESTIFCLDTTNGAWFTWKGLNMAGGVTTFNEETYFMAREYDSATVSVVNRLCKIKKRDDFTDYTDHNKSIKFTLVTSWESLGEPTLFKKFIRSKTFIRDSAKALECPEFTLKLYLRKDFTDYDIGPVELKSGQLGGWGSTIWGQSLWGDRGFEGIRTKLLGKAKSLAFHYENENVNENVLITGIAYEIAAPYRQEIKE